MNARGLARRLFWLTAPFLVLCSAALYLRPDQWAAYRVAAERVMPVYAYRQWQSTGLQLEAGQVVRLAASGEWTYSPQVDLHGPQGALPAPPSYPLPQVPGGALLGRVGDAGEVFYIGRRTMWRATEAGTLYVRINDDLLGDNQGRLTLDVQLQVAASR